MREFPRGTIVRNIKTGTLAYICSTDKIFNGEPVYVVTGVKDGRPAGATRTLRHSQVEEVAPWQE